ncbi:MAG: class I SAM-dependent methyltransferase, partial [Luteitalea sp.]
MRPVTSFSVRRLITLVILCAVAGTEAPVSAQLGGRPAAQWIATLDSPERVANMKIPDLVAALKIRTGQTLADVGSGTGLLSIPLASATGPTGIVYASDIDNDLLAHVTQRAGAAGLGNVKTVRGSFTDPSLPVPVDLALMNDVLHHVSDRAGYVKTLASQIVAGGRLAIIDYTPDGSPHQNQPEMIVS